MEWQTALAYTLVVLLSLAGIYYLYWRYAASPPYVLLPTITSKLCKHNGNKEPHYLAYITAEEHKMLVKKKGLGLRKAGTQGVPCYPKRKRIEALEDEWDFAANHLWDCKLANTQDRLRFQAERNKRARAAGATDGSTFERVDGTAYRWDNSTGRPRRVPHVSQ